MVAGILEKSKRLRKAFFIVKRLPISGTAEGRAKPRIVGRRLSCRKPRRGTYLLEPCLLRTLPVKALTAWNQNLQKYRAAGKSDGASAGTVVPADANQGVSPFLI